MLRSGKNTVSISRPANPGIASTNRTFLRSPFVLALALVCGVFLIEMAYALYTQDTWEDFYIMFRSSRNLAMGKGLVFTPGERVQSFSTPLHTLLLAGLSVLTGNGSEQPVLWLSRILMSGALAGAVLILLRVCRQAGFGLAATAFVVLFLMIDTKTVTFTVNGMEVPLMIFFLALAMFAHIQSGRSTNWRLLGIAWAGLEWTRPDGFVYGGLLAAGFLLFPVARSATARRDTVVLYGKALALSIVLYLPWLVGAWIYYGSPIPQTVIARWDSVPNAFSPSHLRGHLSAWKLLLVTRMLDAMFVPAGTMNFPELLPGFWPFHAVYSRGLAVLAALYWLAPFARPVGRAASFAFMGLCLYFAYVVPFPMWWYLPDAAWLGITAMGGLISNIDDFRQRLAARQNPIAPFVYGGIFGLSALLLGVQLLCTLGDTTGNRVNQIVNEDGNRKQIGLWLHEHAASPQDTVFTESLGYIGYFSQLKIYDYPGLSSPEVVAAVRKTDGNWPSLIRLLKPSWLVLRQSEVDGLQSNDPALLKTDYSVAKVFDVSQALEKDDILLFNARYVVFHRRG